MSCFDAVRDADRMGGEDVEKQIQISSSVLIRSSSVLSFQKPNPFVCFDSSSREEESILTPG